MHGSLNYLNLVIVKKIKGNLLIIKEIQGRFGNYFGRFGIDLGWFGNGLGTIWGWLWDDLGMVLGRFGDDFGTVWGWFWDDLGTNWGLFGDDFGTMLWRFGVVCLHILVYLGIYRFILLTKKGSHYGSYNYRIPIVQKPLYKSVRVIQRCAESCFLLHHKTIGNRTRNRLRKGLRSSR